MSNDKDSFNRTALLTAARIFGVIFSFAIPMYLGRALEVEEYGTYKQLMIFYWFAQVALNLGLDDSAYYFLRWEPKKFSLFSFNAMIFNLVATSVVALVLITFKTPLSLWLNNPDLAQYIPLLSLLTILTISSMQLEGILIGLDKLKQRLLLEVGVELLKAIAILAGFILFQSIKMVLIFLIALMTARLLLTLMMIHQNKTRENLAYSDAFAYWPQQLKYGLPLGLSRILQNILNLEKFLISSFYSVRDFTFYTVGCFENPLINATQASFYEMANIEMVDAMKNSDPQGALRVWRNMMRKLMMVVIPFVIYMIFFAKEIILFIFSERYIESVPYFIVFNIFVLVAAFNPEPLFRASSQTHTILKIKTVGLLIGGGFLVYLALNSTPLYVLAGKILVISALNFIGLFIGAKLISSSFLRLFRWIELFGIIVVSLLIAAPLQYFLQDLTWHPFWVLALSFSLYLMLNFVFCALTGLIAKDEQNHLLGLFKQMLMKVKL